MKNIERENLFPFFNNNKEIIFLDSGVSTIKPKIVIDKITRFYENYSFPMGKSRNKLNQNVYIQYLDAIDKISTFINANKNELIVSGGTTDGLNKLSNILLENFKKGDQIILGKFEHASNYLPWLRKAKQLKLKILFYELDQNLKIDLKHLSKIINKKTKLIALTHKYNVFGSVNDIKMVRKVVGKNVTIVVDGAQSVGQIKVDVKEMDCDYFVFSAHKMFGPFGVGIIYGKENNLKNIEPFQLGGEMNLGYDEKRIKYKSLPSKFWPGTMNVAGILGLGAAVEFINKYGVHNIEEHNKNLKRYLEKELAQIDGINIINKNIDTSILYFEVKDSLGEIVSRHLEEYNIYIRAGASCVKMENNLYKQYRAIRISLHFYNNKNDLDQLISTLKNIKDFSKLKYKNDNYE